MGERIKNIGAALLKLHAVCSDITAAGYTLTGSVFCTKPARPQNSEAIKYVSPDGRVGVYRLLPPGSGGANGSGKPAPGPALAAAAAAAAPSFNPPAEKMSAAQAVAVLAAAPALAPRPRPAKGLGEVCATCGGVDFEQRGTCMYCTSCGDSLGGCS